MIQLLESSLAPLVRVRRLVLCAFALTVFSAPGLAQTPSSDPADINGAGDAAVAFTRVQDVLAQGFLLGLGENALMGEILQARLDGCTLHLFRVFQPPEGRSESVQQILLPLGGPISMTSGRVTIAPLPSGESVGEWIDVQSRPGDIKWWSWIGMDSARRAGSSNYFGGTQSIRLFSWGTPETASAKTTSLESRLGELTRACGGEVRVD